MFASVNAMSSHSKLIWTEADRNQQIAVLADYIGTLKHGDSVGEDEFVKDILALLEKGQPDEALRQVVEESAILHTHSEPGMLSSRDTARLTQFSGPRSCSESNSTGN